MGHWGSCTICEDGFDAGLVSKQVLNEYSLNTWFEDNSEIQQSNSVLFNQAKTRYLHDTKKT